MLDINGIIEIYNQIDLPVLEGSALREDLFLKDLIFEFVRNLYLKKNPDDFFPNLRTYIPNMYSPFTKDKIKDWELTKKKLNAFLKANKHHTIIGKDNPTLVSKIASSYLIESLYCLERTIFWFFNYKYNIIETFEAAGMQALYYSNFFMKTAIQKFLGVSLIHTKYAGKVIVNIDWSKANVEISMKGGGSADHKKLAKNFFELMKNVDLSEFQGVYDLFQADNDALSKFSGISTEQLSRDHSDYLRKARMDYIYDFTTRKSDPFNSFYGSVGSYFKNVQSYCFLDGPEKYNDGSEYYGSDFVPDVYGGWGINEHFIGSLMKFLIKNLRKIQNLENYLMVLSQKIKGPEEFDETAKEIIQGWLSI